MRKEIGNWWKQAENDLVKANVLFRSKNFDGCAFYCQQAVEKSLKALILMKTKQKSVEGHSLIYLGRLANLPSPFFSDLKRLSPQYYLSRYPDITEEVPYELYDENLAKEFLNISDKVLKWIKKHLK